MPTPIVKRLNQAIVDAIYALDLAPRLATEGIRIRGTSPEAFQDLLVREIQTWRKVIQHRGIKRES